MSWFLIILLVFLGCLLIAIDFVALPTFFVSILGACMTGVGIWQCYEGKGTTAGTILLIAAIVLTLSFVAFFIRSRTWRHFSLNEQMDSKVNTIDDKQITVGTRGTTITRCAPSGNDLFDCETKEVHSQGTFINENRPIEIIEIEGYKITVKEVTEE